MEKATRILIATDIHYTPKSQCVYYGADNDERLESFVDRVNKEYEKDPFEAIVYLGDYSLDHWQWGSKGSWLELKESYTKKFIEKYASRLPKVPMYFAPGNHEQFNDIQWQGIVGHGRNTYAVIGDYLFILWDAFGGNLNPTEHSDGTYTPIDVKWAREIMDKYPDKKILLGSHWIEPSLSSEEEIALIQDERVVALFVGHDHHSDASDAHGKKVIHCGNYSFYWTSSVEHATAYMWGFRDMYLSKDKIVTRYIVPDNVAHPQKTEIKMEYHYQDEFEIAVK